MQFLIVDTNNKLINTIEAESTDEARQHRSYKENYSVIPIERNQKYENGEIKIKSLKELYNENIITKEEYEKIIDDNRIAGYEEKVDAKVIEFMRIFINHNLDFETLNDEQKRLLSEINAEVFSVKLKNPKATI